MYDLKDYLNDINHGKKNLMDGDDEFWEKKYPAFIINKCLSAFTDTIFYVNEMNRLNHSIRKRKRFAKWIRSAEVENIEYVKEYYGYSNVKAKQALDVLTDEDIKIIKTKLIRGGKHGRIGVDT